MTLDSHHVLILGNQTQQQTLDKMMQSWGIHAEVAENSAKAMATLIQHAESAQPFSTLIVHSDEMLDIEPAKFAKMVKSDALLHELSLLLINTSSQLISEDISNHYISVIQGQPDKTSLFNALHAAHSSTQEHEKVIRLADFYASQGLNRPLNILVCEDNKVNQHVLRGVLHHAGHKTLLAENGEMALDMLSQQTDAIDMVILDMNMPGMSGLEVLKTFRFMDTSASIPVIMLTADATPEAKQNCKDAGADAFLTKPINSRALLEKVAHLSAEIDSHSALEVQDINQNTDELLDIHSLEQLAKLGDQNFLETLIDSFKEDAVKHIGLIKLHCHDDYLTLRESLHALKGSATEMSAVKLASVCAEAEQVKPDEMGQEHITSLATDIERLFNETIKRLEKKFIPSRHDSRQHTH